MNDFMFPLSGDPEKDAETARQIRRHNHLEAEGMCLNGCAPVVWDDEYTCRCPQCGYTGRYNVPYGGRTPPR